MIKYSVKDALGDTTALHIGMLPGHKRPSIWIEKYGENYIIGSLRSDRAVHDLEAMIDAMLHPEKAIQQYEEMIEASTDDYDFTRDDMNYDAWREGR